MRSVQSAVVNGVYEEKVLDTWLATSEGSSKISPPWGPEKGMRPGQSFGILNPAYYSLGQYLEYSFLSGRVYTDYERIIFENTPNSDLLEAVFYGTSNSTKCDASKDSVICAMNNVADAITKTFRDVRVRVNGAEAADTAIGLTMVPTTYVRVDFRWITLPLFVWFCGAVAWIGTVWKAKRLGTPLWRANPLPLLLVWGGGRSDNMQCNNSNFEYQTWAEGRKAQLNFNQREASDW